MVLVTEIDATSKKGHKVIRGTPEKLIGQLTEDPESLDTGTGAPSVGPGAIVDPTYVEDFLLTYRTFTRHVLVPVPSTNCPFWPLFKRMRSEFQRGSIPSIGMVLSCHKH